MKQISAADRKWSSQPSLSVHHLNCYQDVCEVRSKSLADLSRRSEASSDADSSRDSSDEEKLDAKTDAFGDETPLVYVNDAKATFASSLAVAATRETAEETGGGQELSVICEEGDSECSVSPSKASFVAPLPLNGRLDRNVYPRISNLDTVSPSFLPRHFVQREISVVSSVALSSVLSSDEHELTTEDDDADEEEDYFDLTPSERMNLAHGIRTERTEQAKMRASYFAANRPRSHSGCPTFPEGWTPPNLAAGLSGGAAPADNLKELEKGERNCSQEDVSANDATIHDNESSVGDKNSFGSVIDITTTAKSAASFGGATSMDRSKSSSTPSLDSTCKQGDVLEQDQLTVSSLEPERKLSAEANNNINNGGGNSSARKTSKTSSHQPFFVGHRPVFTPGMAKPKVGKSSDVHPESDIAPTDIYRDKSTEDKSAKVARRSSGLFGWPKKQKPPKDKKIKSEDGHVFVPVYCSSSAVCNGCGKPLSKADAVECSQCEVVLHDACKDQVAACSKFKHPKVVSKLTKSIHRDSTISATSSIDETSPQHSNAGDSFRSGSIHSHDTGVCVDSISGTLDDQLVCSSIHGAEMTSSPLDTSARPIEMSTPVSTHPQQHYSASQHKHHVHHHQQRFSMINPLSLATGGSYGVKHTRSGSVPVTISLPSTLQNSNANAGARFDAFEAMKLREMGLDSVDAEAWSVSLTDEKDKKELKQMHTKDIKRQDIIFELIATEKHHCSILVTLKTVYYASLKTEIEMMERSPLSTQDLDETTPSLDELLDVHIEFYRKLKARQIEASKVPGKRIDRIHDLILDTFTGENGDKMVAAYVKLCSMKEQAIRKYRQLCTTYLNIQNVIRQIQMVPQYKNKSLPDCLLLITQRLSKYHVLVEQIRKTTRPETGEAEEIATAETAVKALIGRVNAGVDYEAMTTQIAEICRKFDPRSFVYFRDLTFTHESLRPECRRIIFIDKVDVKSAKKNENVEVDLFLYSDVVCLLHKSSSSGMYSFAKVDDKSAVIPLQGMLVREIAQKKRYGVYLICLDAPRQRKSLDGAGGGLPNAQQRFHVAGEMYEIYAKGKNEFARLHSILQQTVRDFKPELNRVPEAELTSYEEEPNLPPEIRQRLSDLLAVMTPDKDDMITQFFEGKLQLYRELRAILDSLPLRGNETMCRQLMQLIDESFQRIGDHCKQQDIHYLPNFLIHDDAYHYVKQSLHTPDLPRRAETFHGTKDCERLSAKGQRVKKHLTVSGINDTQIVQQQADESAMANVSLGNHSVVSKRPSGGADTSGLCREISESLLERLGRLEAQVQKLTTEKLTLAAQLVISGNDPNRAPKRRPVDIYSAPLEQLRQYEAKLSAQKREFEKECQMKSDLFAAREADLQEREAKVVKSNKEIQEKWMALQEECNRLRARGVNVGGITTSPPHAVPSGNISHRDSFLYSSPYGRSAPAHDSYVLRANNNNQPADHYLTSPQEPISSGPFYRHLPSAHDFPTVGRDLVDDDARQIATAQSRDYQQSAEAVNPVLAGVALHAWQSNANADAKTRDPKQAAVSVPESVYPSSNANSVRRAPPTTASENILNYSAGESLVNSAMGAMDNFWASSEESETDCSNASLHRQHIASANEPPSSAIFSNSRYRQSDKQAHTASMPNNENPHRSVQPQQQQVLPPLHSRSGSGSSLLRTPQTYATPPTYNGNIGIPIYQTPPELVGGGAIGGNGGILPFMRRSSMRRNSSLDSIGFHHPQPSAAIIGPGGYHFRQSGNAGNNNNNGGAGAYHHYGHGGGFAVSGAPLVTAMAGERGGSAPTTSKEEKQSRRFAAMPRNLVGGVGYPQQQQQQTVQQIMPQHLAESGGKKKKK